MGRARHTSLSNTVDRVFEKERNIIKRAGRKTQANRGKKKTKGA